MPHYREVSSRPPYEILIERRDGSHKSSVGHAWTSEAARSLALEAIREQADWRSGESVKVRYKGNFLARYEGPKRSSSRDRDRGPVRAKRVFRSHAAAARYQKRLSHRHPEATIRRTNQGFEVRWRTRSVRDPDGADLDAFNTKLAKLMLRLKKDAGAEVIRQNYKGTGSRKHRRQLWVRFRSGAVVDLWLDSGFLGLGGVALNRPPGSTADIATRRISYEGRTPEEVYAEAARVLDAWANASAARDPSRGLTSGQPVEVRKIWAGGRHPQYHWTDNYVFVRMRNPSTAVVRHTAGVYEGIEANYPINDVRPSAARDRSRRVRRLR